ncbi:NUDIX hydrolase [Paenibacillus baekrokdamisoli]|uniref:NUDIX hydrolase n=1 Tax=Paenibacillus baekrokdamisoli TaxID=1712516 RepID=A0A3G9JBR2_9BACL|nr:NUDIX domain-containing protein [Paenibacillus baekrokdamisoli]MBB3073479.1 ADP-ribose pyrophosphatase YjhB (NUDIX family) [Paenibacillus baekrokdamisoli]BBH20439.1 NUDIX hydrolase [Paenibacillus baekrokdamisoli]
MSMSDYYKDLRNKFGPELIFVPAVVGIIRNEENEILFGRKHNEDVWGLIAGAIEISETPNEAVCREVLEETGLVVTPERIIGVFGGEKHRYIYSNGHKVEYLTIVFECKVIGGKLTPDNDEMKELKYFKETEIPPIVNPYPKEIFIREYTERAIFE